MGLAAFCRGIAITTIFFLLSSCGNEEIDWFAQSHHIKIATASKKGVYNEAGKGIQALVNAREELIHINVELENTEGSVYNINAIIDGSVDMAFAQSDRQYQAYYGLASWINNPQKKLRFICSFHPELLTFIVAKDSTIRGLADMRGKTINIGGYGSGTRGNVLDCLTSIGFVENVDFKAQNLSTLESVMMLKDGRIDGFFATTGHPSELVSKILKGEREVHFVPIVGMEKMMRMFPYYHASYIPARYYFDGMKSGNVPTVGVLATLLASVDMDEEEVYLLVKTLMENLADFKKGHPSFSELTAKEMLRGEFAPMHSGAERYFKEVGLR